MTLEFVGSKVASAEELISRGRGRPKMINEGTIIELVNQLPNKSASASELAAILGVSRTTVWRFLARLRNDGKISYDGEMGGGSATKWTTKTASEYLSNPERGQLPVEYDFDRIGAYVPNKSQLMPADVMSSLMKLGSSAQTHSAADVVARVRAKILVEMSWASSVLEGNKFSLGETIQLFENGDYDNKKKATDATMLLNHRDAISYVMDNIAGIKIDADTVCNVHAMLSAGLLSDSSLEGQYRSHGVIITGSVYHPLSDPNIIQRELGIMLSTAEEIRNPFEKSFFLLANLAYLQTFTDVNKRTARVTCNIPLMQSGLCPLSFFDFKREAYEEGIVHYYETGRSDRLAQAYLEGYDMSVSRYKDLLHHVGSSDDVTIRAEFRSIIYESVRNYVLDSSIDQLTDSIDKALASAGRLESTAPEKRTLLDPYVERIVEKLHEGQLALYGIKKDELKAFRMREENRSAHPLSP
ncbi:MAG: Fic family protein [bacterium]|nr:Fic family protein [bacterium]